MAKIPVITVDDNVPVPNPRGNYPLDSMEVGDSFVFPEDKRPSVASMASVLKKKTGKEFTSRKVEDNKCRIWRTK